MASLAIPAIFHVYDLAMPYQLLRRLTRMTEATPATASSYAITFEDIPDPLFDISAEQQLIKRHDIES